MSIKVETAKVYRGGGRRWLTKKAAINAEAKMLIKRKHPTEKGDASIGDFGFHWSMIDRNDVLLRRVLRLVKNATI